jgi:hypothetical protein
MKLFVVCLAALALCAVAGSTVQAATLSYTASVPLQSTDWNTTVSIPQLSPAAGLLTGVTIAVRDSLVANFRFENTSPSSGNTVRDSSKATVQVFRPDNTMLLSTIAAKEQTAVLPVYDGVIDWGGLSGRTYLGMVNVATGSSVFSAPADLALFAGTGYLSLPCKAVGRSYTSDTAGNVVHSVQTQAAAWVTVTYTYNVITPVSGPSWGSLRRSYR